MIAVLTTSELDNPVMRDSSSRALSLASFSLKLCCRSRSFDLFLANAKSYTKILKPSGISDLVLYTSV